MPFWKKTDNRTPAVQPEPSVEPATLLQQQSLEQPVEENLTVDATPKASAAIPAKEDAALKESDLTAAISRNTLVKGNITTDDNIDIFGTVEGNVTSTAIVRIYGKVTGDIICGVLVANNATIIGSITCENSVVLGNQTSAKGDILAKNITVSGKVEGDLAADDLVSISGDGCVYGNVRTPQIEVSKGAIIFGTVTMEQKPEPVSEEPVPEEVPVAPQEEPAEEPDSIIEDAAADSTADPYESVL